MFVVDTGVVSVVSGVVVTGSSVATELNGSSVGPGDEVPGSSVVTDCR